MISAIVSLLLTVVEFLFKKHEASNSTKTKLNRIVQQNRDLLDENTKIKIAKGISDANEKLDHVNDSLDNANSLQQQRDILNKQFKNDDTTK